MPGVELPSATFVHLPRTCVVGEHPQTDRRCAGGHRRIQTPRLAKRSPGPVPTIRGAHTNHRAANPRASKRPGGRRHTRPPLLGPRPRSQSHLGRLPPSQRGTSEATVGLVERCESRGRDRVSRRSSFIFRSGPLRAGPLGPRHQLQGSLPFPLSAVPLAARPGETSQGRGALYGRHCLDVIGPCPTHQPRIRHGGDDRTRLLPQSVVTVEATRGTRRPSAGRPPARPPTGCAQHSPMSRVDRRRSTQPKRLPH